MPLGWKRSIVWNNGSRFCCLASRCARVMPDAPAVCADSCYSGVSFHRNCRQHDALRREVGRPLPDFGLYRGLRLAASAASFSWSLTCSSNSLAFWAWPFMSHSLARCASMILSKAWRLSRCAAARFGCRAPEIFLSGLWATATPPRRSREPTTAVRRRFLVMAELNPAAAKELRYCPHLFPQCAAMMCIRIA
jgi:hypothetical protein